VNECSEKVRILEIEKRLGSGDVTLAQIGTTMNQVLVQVQKTNGRVSRLELFRTMFVNLGIGIAVGMLIYGLGFFEFVKEVL
jgi:hypothetical protein